MMDFALQGVVDPTCGVCQVSFQWKNPDFPFKNPDFLLRNPHFLLKDDDFIIKQAEGEGFVGGLCSCSFGEWEGAKYLCSPPLRSADDQDALWEALRDGALQVISSDHSAYNFEGTSTFLNMNFP